MSEITRRQFLVEMALIASTSILTGACGSRPSETQAEHNQRILLEGLKNNVPYWVTAIGNNKKYPLLDACAKNVNESITGPGIFIGPQNARGITVMHMEFCIDQNKPTEKRYQLMAFPNIECFKIDDTQIKVPIDSYNIFHLNTFYAKNKATMENRIMTLDELLQLIPYASGLFATPNVGFDNWILPNEYDKRQIIDKLWKSTIQTCYHSTKRGVLAMQNAAYEKYLFLPNFRPNDKWQYVPDLNGGLGTSILPIEKI